MRIKFKRGIAVFLAMAMILGLRPELTFAGNQNPVTELTIENVRPDTGAYVVSLDWSAPSVMTEEDEAAAYQVKARRAVNNNRVEYSYPDTEVTEAVVTIQNPVRGSIYEFSVRPFHTHRVETNGEQVVTNHYALDSAKALYLTDIRVEAKGKMVTDEETGNSYPTMEVTWDAPKYDNDEAFTHYLISYVAVTGDGADYNGAFNGGEEIVETSKAIESFDTSADPSIRRLTFTLPQDPYIVQGAKYSVKVEPYNKEKNTEYRAITSAAERNVNINGKTYPIDFKQTDEAEYRVDNVGIPFTLEASEYSEDYLKLSWNQIKTNTAPAGSVIVLYSSENEKDWSKIAILYDVARNYYLVPRPTKNRKYYKLRIFDSQAAAMSVSDGESGDSDDSIIITSDLPNPFYDPSRISITPTDPEIYALSSTNASSSGSISLRVEWNPFIREYFEGDSRAELITEDYNSTEYIRDTDVVYDFWISDSLEVLQKDDHQRIPPNLTPSASGTFTLDAITKRYSYEFNRYYHATNRQQESITTNKLYYMKVVAKKEGATLTKEGSRYRYSQPVYVTVYISPTGAIATPPMISKPPLTIKKDAEGAEMITDTSITLEWKYDWLEVLELVNKKGEAEWHSDKVGVKDGKLIFGEAVEDADEKLDLTGLKSLTELTAIMKQENYLLDSDQSFVARSMDLSDAMFEYKIITYSEVINRIGSQSDYEEYLQKMTAEEPAGIPYNEGSGHLWRQITPAYDVNDVSKERPYVAITGLAQNTPYFILFRAYRVIDQEGTKVAYPTYVIATTLPPGKVITVKPTVPSLELVKDSVYDMGFTVRWKSSASLRYALSYSDIYDDPLLGTQLTWESIESYIEYDDSESDKGINYMTLDIGDLFPDTEYKVWIYAYTDLEKSEWSNDLLVKTANIDKPKPPQGLGIAAASDIKILNDQLETKYIPVDYNYMILEWIRGTEDQANALTGATADANVRRFANPLLQDVFIVMYSNLVGNRDYYVRGKTISTITRDKNGAATKTYSYVIQLSQSEDFTTYTQICAPPIPTVTDERYYRQTESEFTIPLVIRTLPTTGEYDGEADPDMYPLPQEDFEITYNASTGELVYRFRGNQVDGSGAHDNQVDQRFISKLIAGGYHVYGIDLTSYDNKKITKRTVEMPYSIIKAMTNSKIDFKVKADNTTLTIPYGALETSDFAKTRGLNTSSIVTISIDQGVTNLPKLNEGDAYISAAQSISMSVKTQHTTDRIAYSAKPFKIAMETNNRYSSLDTNIGAYYTAQNEGTWTRLNAQTDLSGPTVAVESARLGTFSAIAKKNEVVVMGSNEYALSDAIYAVTSKLVFTDRSSFNQKSNVTANQFNNIMYAVSKNKNETAFSHVISQQEQATLVKASIGTSQTGSGEVTRQEAINALVNLYEAKTGRRIASSSTLATTSYADIASANAQYQKNLLKAGDIGMLREGANPEDALTFGEFMYMLDIVMQDAGY